MTLASLILNRKSELNQETTKVVNEFGSHSSGIYSYEKISTGIIRKNIITGNLRLYNFDGSLNTKNWKEEK